MAVYPSNFIGPIQNGSTRTGPANSQVLPSQYPSNFIGPIPNGATRNGPATGGGGSNGGGGNSGGGSSGPTQPSTYYDQGTGQTFGSYNDYLGQIDSVFGDANNIINQQKTNLQASEPDLLDAASKPYEAQLPLLGQARDVAVQGNQQQQNANSQNEQTVISQARRLANELFQRTQQQFGGSNSAAEFGNSIVGQQLQRNEGQAQNTSGQNQQQLMDKANSIQSDYQTKLQSINLQKDAAVAQAKDMFNQRMDAINNNQLGLATNKAQAKLAALQDLRNQSYQIQQQATAFQQQLQAQANQAMLNTQQMIDVYKSASGQPVNLAAFGAPSYSQYGGGQTNTNPSITGQFGTSRKTDAFGNPIA